MKLAVIPARGGSKRIPHKNIKNFCGKPLIAYSIEAARQSGVFDHIWVSTDSAEIAQIATDYGATAPFIRPDSLADDFTGTGPVTVHAIRSAIECGITPQWICCIYATAPFLQPEFLREGLCKLEQNSDLEFAFSVTSFPFPVQRAIVKTQDGGVEPLQPECIGQRSQDLPEALHDAGQFYWGKTSAWLEGKAMFAPHSSPVELPRFLVQDIDTQEDWQRAELMYKAYGDMIQRGKQ